MTQNPESAPRLTDDAPGAQPENPVPTEPTGGVPTADQEPQAVRDEEALLDAIVGQGPDEDTEVEKLREKVCDWYTDEG